MLRLYASVAPEWWPFQLVSMANQRLPPKRYLFYHLLVDNGMFGFYKRGERPSIAEWYARLRGFLDDVFRRRKPLEIVVILPDWLNDPVYTLASVTSPFAARLCRIYKCMAVVHVDRATVVSYREAADAGVELHGLAAPLKLNCSRIVAGRRVVSLECQAAIAEQVCGVARRLGLQCHGLGAALRPSHVKRLASLGVTSIDSSSWARPINTEKARSAPWSANTREAKEQQFKQLLQRLLAEGIEIEAAREALAQHTQVEH